MPLLLVIAALSLAASSLGALTNTKVNEDFTKGAVMKAAGYPDDQIDPELYNELFERFDFQKNCIITGMKPSKPRSLSFCYKNNEASCCAPAQDAEIADMFDALFALGLSCRLRGDIRNHPIAHLYCLSCDPNQPRYVRPEPESGNDNSLLICQEWAESEFGSSPVLGVFSKCGIKQSSPCLDGNGDKIPNRDRYTCGDDLIFPDVAYRVTHSNGTVDVVATLETFLNSDDLGPPNVADIGSVYYKIVENRPCTATEAGEQNPACLLTSEQLYDKYGGYDDQCDSDPQFKVENPDVCATYRDELCFNSAASVAVSVLMLVVLALVPFFLL